MCIGERAECTRKMSFEFLAGETLISFRRKPGSEANSSNIFLGYAALLTIRDLVFY
jgi:hypothetical protein